MASGLPIVTAHFPQNGTVAVVLEFGCGLCADATTRDLANAVQAVHAEWQMWSARSRMHAEVLNWSSLIPRFEALLQHAAAAASNASSIHKIEGLPCDLH
jgi:glycosyltransferase involved in cell wall biosynthesis